LGVKALKRKKLFVHPRLGKHEDLPKNLEKRNERIGYLVKTSEEGRKKKKTWDG